MSCLIYISVVILGVTCLITFVGFHFDNIPSTNSDLVIRMMASLDDNRKDFKEQNKSAFVLGYTGEVGKELVKELLNSELFNQVVLIGRREVKYEDKLYTNVEQRVIDFENLDEHASAFQGFNIGFCSLGSTRAKAGGAKEFYHIDHDYVVSSAKLAKDGGCEQFHLVSSMGASAKSSNLYMKTKGETEQHIQQLEFDRFITYRPGMLLCDREESRPMESVVKFFVKPITKMFPTWISVPTATVAKAMVNAAVAPNLEAFSIMENKDIFKLAEGKTTKNKDDAEGKTTKSKENDPQKAP